MGEGSKPELVTVMPLTRGSGNHGGPTVSSGGGGSGRPIEIHLHNEVGVREFQSNQKICIGRFWIAGIMI